MNINKIVIKSNNPDCNGVWKKDDVIQEMKDIFGDDDIAQMSWIEYIIDHVFDFVDFEHISLSQHIYAAMCDEAVHNITFEVGPYRICFTKS